MSGSKIISRQWPLVVHLSRGLVGWSQVVWLGNGHKAVTVQGPRRPLLRSVLCSILILGLLPPPPVADQPLTSSPTSPTTALQRPTSPSKDQDALKTALLLYLSCCRPGPQSLQVKIFLCFTPNIKTFSPFLNSMHSRCSESENLTLRTEGTTMSTLGSRPFLTSLRFFCIVAWGHKNLLYQAKSTQTGAKGAEVVFLLYRLQLYEILMIDIEPKTRWTQL